MKPLNQYISSDPYALTIEDVEALLTAFPERVAIYAKHLIEGEKQLVHYSSPEEAVGDQERYGSVWVTVDGEKGILRMKDYDTVNS